MLLIYKKFEGSKSQFLNPFSRLKMNVEPSKNYDPVMRKDFPNTVSGKMICDFLESYFFLKKEECILMGKRMLIE
jgi:hypothetical protein